MSDDIETINDQLVSTRADHVLVLAPKQQMTRTEALRQAAWLVTMAYCVGPTGADVDAEFAAVLAAVRGT